MKLLLILTLLLAHLFADTTKQDVTIGAGGYYQTQPYKGVDNLFLPSPVLFFDNGLFYVRWTQIGVYFLGQNDGDTAWAFSLTAQPRIYGYKSSDIPGMTERKNSFEGGLDFSAKRGDLHVESMLVTDMLYKSKAWIFKTEAGYDFKISNFSFYPTLILTYQSAQFTDYYYGVKRSEASPTKAEYRAKGGVQLGVQTYIEYPLSKDLSLFLNIKLDRLSHEASKSPIVKDKHIYSGLASILYHFEY